jgi:glutamate racemase
VANDRVRFALFLKLAQAFRFRTPCIISTMASSRRPQLGRPKIGVFDSGVGGLTVLRALVDRIPEADYLYFGDTARLPYGSKSAATVAHYAVGAVRYLQDQGAELLVIACNTATALALDEIKSAAGVEVIGVIEPGAEAAAAASRKRTVVVIGTDATISSHAYRRALEARKVAVREKACPLFVPLVEEGWVEHPVTEQVARIYLSEAFSDDESDADVLVLGCTHYPLIKPLLRRVAPEHIAIVDSAESTAQNVVRQLQVGTLPSTKSERRSPPGLRFFATDSAEKFRRMGTRFLGLPVEDVVHVDLKE